MVGLDGEKMSKSKGNLVLVSRLRESGLDPMVIRLVLLGHHYRSDWQWDEADVSAAGARLDKWRGAAAKPPAPPRSTSSPTCSPRWPPTWTRPFALRLLDHWANATDFGDDSEPGAGEVIRPLVDAALGVRALINGQSHRRPAYVIRAAASEIAARAKRGSGRSRATLGAACRQQRRRWRLLDACSRRPQGTSCELVATGCHNV